VEVEPVITGIGLVTSLGRTVAHTWQALLVGASIKTHARVEGDNRADIPRVAAIGIEAANQAIAQARWGDMERDAAVICCTSKGAVESWLDAANTKLTTSLTSFGLSDLSTVIARQFGLTNGPRLTLSAACAGGLHGLIRAAMMIQTGEVSRVLVVASEASVHPLFLGSFKRLGVLPKDGEVCRPFDINRSGFLMSDAAAAICIEAHRIETTPRDMGLQPVPGAIGFKNPSTSNVQIAIDQFAMGGDATHLTGSDPDGKVLCHLLRKTIKDRSVDLIHAHGTGTVSNDSTELAAMESVVANQPPVHLYSHKGALGHSLGASGLVSVVINCMCHQTGMVPPNINTIEPLKCENIRIGRGIARRTVRRSIIHAAGFGGPTAVVSLRTA
jgi:3-oxoacyl-[acyl-carrier-protein] synthase II